MSTKTTNTDKENDAIANIYYYFSHTANEVNLSIMLYYPIPTVSTHCILDILPSRTQNLELRIQNSENIY